MSAAGLRLGRKCSGLLLSRMSMAALVPTPRVQPSPPRVQPSPAGSLCARTLGWGARAFSDAAGQGSSLLPYGALAEPNPRENTPSLEDLNGAPPLSPFDEIGDEEAVQILATPPLPPVSTSLRDYVDQSETLSMLVQLGVDLFQLQQRGGAVGSMLLRLELQDVQERLLFLRDLGLQDSQLGPLLTRNPFILTESMHNLQGRVSYLRSKRFSSEAVSSMVSRAPYLLNFSIERLDNRLAFFQSHLGLSPHKTRDLVTRLPRLLCGSLEPVKENLKVCALELGFRPNEIQHIVTTVPKVLTASKRRLTETFDYVHNTMSIPHQLIARFPQVLNCSLLRIRERHLYLQHLGKARYDPAQAGYVPLERLVALPDAAFCSELASTSLEDFERFHKTL